MVQIALDTDRTDGKPTAEAYDRAVSSYLTERKLGLEKGFTFLATLASNAPFIGLFGTVLGIIEAFGILSSNANSGMNAVMWKLAEALVATAVGLLVAIPAVVAYNAYSQKIRNHFAECESIRDLFISKKV
jgi:biopolymer transport protein ExbB/TolQ